MNNGQSSAFPITNADNVDQIMVTNEEGLTKREYFAGLAMQGLLTNTIYHNPNEKAKMITVSALVETAVNYADALLEELEKTQP